MGWKVNEMNYKKAKILECILEMDVDKLVALHNNYCKAKKRLDKTIYAMYDLDEMLDGSTPTDILCMGCYGDFSLHNNYFWFDVQGNLESADFAYNMPILFADIVEYILATGDTLENDEFKDLFNEIAEQEVNF